MILSRACSRMRAHSGQADMWGHCNQSGIGRPVCGRIAVLMAVGRHAMVADTVLAGAEDSEGGPSMMLLHMMAVESRSAVGCQKGSAKHGKQKPR
mgnify:CR=1 FL=1